MKVLFHTNTLNYRGTSVAVTDYAKYNQEILGNESIILYNRSIPYERDMGTESIVVSELSKQFNIISYDGNKREDELNRICKEQGVDVAYFIKSGAKNGELPPDRAPSLNILADTRTCVHAVFQVYQPHGDRYAYVSEWLSNVMSPADHLVPFVPHIVSMPPPDKDIREALGIPKTAVVFGRYGGYTTFDLSFVKEHIRNILAKYSDIYFVFANTEPFVDHPNVKYIKQLITPQGKSNFISACDAMLHARGRGESFGLSVAEFLFHNKPVLAWRGGQDKNHLEMLNNSNLIYSETDLVDKILNIKELASKEEWSNRVSQYEPGRVMAKFDEVFLK